MNDELKFKENICYDFRGRQKILYNTYHPPNKVTVNGNTKKKLGAFFQGLNFLLVTFLNIAIYEQTIRRM